MLHWHSWSVRPSVLTKSVRYRSIASRDKLDVIDIPRSPVSLQTCAGLRSIGLPLPLPSHWHVTPAWHISVTYHVLLVRRVSLYSVLTAHALYAHMSNRRTSRLQLLMMAWKGFSLRLLLQVLCYILFVVNQAGSSPADKTIRIGYMLQRMTRAGAINVAIKRAQEDDLLREYNFRYSCSV